jgi:hypothetical protein
MEAIVGKQYIGQYYGYVMCGVDCGSERILLISVPAAFALRAKSFNIVVLLYSFPFLPLQI